MTKLVLISSVSGSRSVSDDSFSADTTQHRWVTVINPTNHRLLLQACDDCGVVKSENSILRACQAVKGQQLVSGLMSVDVQRVS